AILEDSLPEQETALFASGDAEDLTDDPLDHRAAEGLELLLVAAAHRQLGSVFQGHLVVAVEPGVELLDPVDADDGGSVNPEKLDRVELALDSGGRFLVDVTGRSRVEHHVVPSRLDPVDLLGAEEVAPSLRLDE